MRNRIIQGAIFISLVGLIFSSSIITPTLAQNPLYNWNVKAITDDGRPKFFLNMASNDEYIVLSYLTNSTPFDFNDPNLVQGDAKLVTSLETDFYGSKEFNITLDLRIIIMRHDRTVLADILLVKNVAGYQYQIHLDDQNRLHLVYMRDLGLASHYYTPEYTTRTNALFYVRYDRLVTQGVITPDKNVTINNIAIDLVADPVFGVGNNGVVAFAWASKLSTPQYRDPNSTTINFFRNLYTIRYAVLDTNSNNLVSWVIENRPYMLGTNVYPETPDKQFYRRPGILLDGDKVHLVYNDRSQTSSETVLRYLQFPIYPTGMNWTEGDTTNSKGFGKGVSIARVIGNTFTRTPIIFKFQDKLWVAYVQELAQPNPPSVTYTTDPENSNVQWNNIRFDQRTRAMLSLDIAIKKDLSAVNLIWSLEFKPENPKLTWTYDAFLATYKKTATNPRLDWDIRRITLVDEVAHTYPVIEYVGDELQTFWIQITVEPYTYDIYAAKPVIIQFPASALVATIVILILELSITIVVSIFMINKMKTEGIKKKIGRITTQDTQAS